VLALEVQSLESRAKKWLASFWLSTLDSGPRLWTLDSLLAQSVHSELSHTAFALLLQDNPS